MNYKLIIFDLDGTILNTLEDLTDSTNFALRINNFPERRIDEVRKFVGNGIGKLIERALPTGTEDETVKSVLKDFRKHYESHCAVKTRPYDGITELIEKLRANGCMTAVVSNKEDVAAQELCKKYFPALFDFVVGERENIKRKPAPDTVNEVLRILNIDRSEAVYVGDSEVDIKTAENAGMSIVSVTWGFRDLEFLKTNGAGIIINYPDELIHTLEN